MDDFTGIEHLNYMELDIDAAREQYADQIDALCESLSACGLDESDLDDLTDEIWSHYGTELANQTDDPDKQDEEIGLASAWGSDINNGGMGRQLGCMIAFYGFEQAVQRLKDAFPDCPLKTAADESVSQ